MRVAVFALLVVMTAGVLPAPAAAGVSHPKTHKVKKHKAPKHNG